MSLEGTCLCMSKVPLDKTLTQGSETLHYQHPSNLRRTQVDTYSILAMWAVIFWRCHMPRGPMVVLEWVHFLMSEIHL